MLSAKYTLPMSTTRSMAQALGRRGGQARARRLPSAEQRRIAALGGAARSRSFEVARRIAVNFAYLAATRTLSGRTSSAIRVATCKGPLPGLYPDRT